VVGSAVALIAYKAITPTQISFAKGETLALLGDSGRWWSARTAIGEVGLVSRAMVKRLTTTRPKAAAGMMAAGSDSCDAGSSPKMEVDMSSGIRGVAKESYFPAGPEGLQLKRGELLLVIPDRDMATEHDGDFWLVANKEGDTGFVPATHVRQFGSSQKSSTLARKQTHTSTGRLIRDNVGF
jgi:hypothetical protein